MATGRGPGSLGSYSPSSATVHGSAGGPPPASRAASPLSLGLDPPAAADAGISPSLEPSSFAVRADGGGGGGGSGGAGGAGGSGAVKLKCGLDQVIVSLSAGPVPRPNTSRSLCWIRREIGSESEDTLAFTKYSLDVEADTPSDVNKPLTLAFSITFPKMYIASELRSITGAVSRMETHERGHPREWEETVRDQLPDLCSRIDAEVSSRATNSADRRALISAVTSIVRTVLEEWDALLQASTHSFDDADYPALHADLAALRVPRFRCVNGTSRRD